ncbi:uncharacterized protein BDW43DRAFT_275502 [Aspergillus alliaceus]|uniref:uncharacterized protein n=1 Tax=Petromyces alliaceus TaxID=209559 RepID=UPI0012A59741|nr:uncharacterized protein BDW43DRAFT_275502 [Aspergillus alliaceus]KAB8233564.1 hypothetical protein BDW43DRAFT_275502 [Aspergillus alliaceus]
MLADDSIMLFPGCMMLTSESSPTLKSSLTSDSFTPWKTYVIRDSHVRLLDRHGLCGVVRYRVTAERDLNNKEREQAKEIVIFNALCISTWQKTDEGDWKMASYQQTPC